MSVRVLLGEKVGLSPRRPGKCRHQGEKQPTCVNACVTYDSDGTQIAVASFFLHGMHVFQLSIELALITLWQNSVL